MKIFFDVDSTLVKLEGLDWIAEQKGKSDKVVELTNQSMNGTLKLEDVFAKKMEIISPTEVELKLMSQEYLLNLVEDIQEVIKIFQKLEKDIYIVTGNFHPAVVILATYLGIPEEKVIANKIYFDEQGNYKDFEKTGPLSRSGGKLEIVKNIASKEDYFIGDGSTDLETGEVLNFIGFGGVSPREKIEKGAKYYIKSPSIAPALNIILNNDEKDKVTNEFKSLLEKADSLVKDGFLVVKN